jgi:hypothetical protein
MISVLSAPAISGVWSANYGLAQATWCASARAVLRRLPSSLPKLARMPQAAGLSSGATFSGRGTLDPFDCKVRHTWQGLQTVNMGSMIQVCFLRCSLSFRVGDHPFLSPGSRVIRFEPTDRALVRHAGKESQPVEAATGVSHNLG